MEKILKRKFCDDVLFRVVYYTVYKALFSFAVLEGSVMYSGGSVAEMVLCDSCENDTCSRNVTDIDHHVSSGKPFSRSLSTTTIVECCF